MSTMVERVAKVICDLQHDHGAYDAHLHLRHIFCTIARGAIEEMRDPADINVSDVYDAIEKADPESIVGPEALLAAWRAVIDQFLR